MWLLDVNVLLAAHRDDHPQFDPARTWLDELLSGQDAFTVPAPVAGSFLRIATHRRVFRVPTPLPDALDYLDALTAQPNHVFTTAGRRHLTLLRRTCEEASATGDLVPDAVLAAIAMETAADVVTFDRDLARFPSVRHLRLPSA